MDVIFITADWVVRKATIFLQRKQKWRQKIWLKYWPHTQIRKNWKTWIHSRIAFCDIWNFIWCQALLDQLSTERSIQLINYHRMWKADCTFYWPWLWLRGAEFKYGQCTITSRCKINTHDTRPAQTQPTLSLKFRTTKHFFQRLRRQFSFKRYYWRRTWR